MVEKSIDGFWLGAAGTAIIIVISLLLYYLHRITNALINISSILHESLDREIRKEIISNESKQ